VGNASKFLSEVSFVREWMSGTFPTPYWDFVFTEVGEEAAFFDYAIGVYAGEGGPTVIYLYDSKPAEEVKDSF